MRLGEQGMRQQQQQQLLQQLEDIYMVGVEWLVILSLPLLWTKIGEKSEN